jgi:hypothetical protein
MKDTDVLGIGFILILVVALLILVVALLILFRGR